MHISQVVDSFIKHTKRYNALKTKQYLTNQEMAELEHLHERLFEKNI